MNDSWIKTELKLLKTERKTLIEEAVSCVLAVNLRHSSHKKGRSSRVHGSKGFEGYWLKGIRACQACVLRPAFICGWACCIISIKVLTVEDWPTDSKRRVNENASSAHRHQVPRWSLPPSFSWRWARRPTPVCHPRQSLSSPSPGSEFIAGERSSQYNWANNYIN